MKVSMWSHDWPTEPGLFWFYGWRFGRGREFGGHKEEPELCLVEIGETAVKGVFMYVTHGHFLYREEGATGLWQKTILPELPDLEEVWSK